jgi:hypothetical protein
MKGEQPGHGKRSSFLLAATVRQCTTDVYSQGVYNYSIRNKGVIHIWLINENEKKKKITAIIKLSNTEELTL